MLGHNRRVTHCVPTPNLLVNARTIVHAPRILAQKRHNVVFSARKLAWIARDRHGALGVTDNDVALEPNGGSARLSPLASKMGPYTALKNGERERFCHVIVCARGEAVDLIGILDARSQKNDGAAQPLS